MFGMTVERSVLVTAAGDGDRNGYGLADGGGSGHI